MYMAQELINLFDNFERELIGGTRFTQGGSSKERTTEPYSKYEWWMNELTDYVKSIVGDKESNRKEYEKSTRSLATSGSKESYFADNVYGSSDSSNPITSSSSTDISTFETNDTPSFKKIKNQWIQ
jgi:hypothetical protein